jgi:hypothetical protein
MRAPKAKKVQCGRPTEAGTPCKRNAPARVGVCLLHAGAVCMSPIDWSGKVCLAPSTSGAGMTATCDDHDLTRRSLKISLSRVPRARSGS